MQVTFFGLQFYYDDLIEYPAGHYLLKEGQKQNCIYVLKKGKVKILKNSQEIALCDQRGDMFGEVAALTGEECSSTVRLAEASEFFVIEDADQFLVQKPSTTLFIAKMLARRLADTTRGHAFAKMEVADLAREKPQKHSPM